MVQQICREIEVLYKMALITTFAYDAVAGVPNYTSGNIADWLYQLTFKNTGVIPGSDLGLAVTTDGIGNVLTQNGTCSLYGRSATLTAGPQTTLIPNLPANGYRTAYAVVVRFNTSTQLTAITVIEGSTIANPGPAVNPSIDTLTDVLLAYVLAVNTGSITYTVTDGRSFTNTGTLTPTTSITYTKSDLNINTSIIAPITAAATINITAGSIYQGTTLLIKNTSIGGFDITLHYSASLADITIPPGAWTSLLWDGTSWLNTTINSDWDLIIDSNAKLDLWAAHTGGLYKRVLIKYGAWTATTLGATAGVLINLDNTGTKYIFAEKGATITYSGTYAGAMYGFYHSTISTDVSSESFHGIKITMINAGGTCSAFYKMLNLYNCNAITQSSTTAKSIMGCKNVYSCFASGSGETSGVGFDTSTNLISCDGVGYGITNGYGYGFSSCTNIDGGTANGYGAGINAGFGITLCQYVSNFSANGTGSASSSSGTGIASSNYLTNCIAIGVAGGANGAGFGISSGSYISGCSGTGTGAGTGAGVGIYTAFQLSGCTAVGQGATSVPNYGFKQCVGIVNCKSTGLNTGAGTGIGYSDCKKLTQNSPYGPSKTSTYATSYADGGTAVLITGSSDTAALGWNTP